MGRVVHFEIRCDDLDRAERFYSTVFGWDITHWENAPIDYRLISTGAEGEPGIDGALTSREGALDSQGGVGYVNTIQVDDLAQTEQRIDAAGGERIVEAALVPGVGTVAYFKDSEGNTFAALQPV